MTAAHTGAKLRVTATYAAALLAGLPAAAWAGTVPDSGVAVAASEEMPAARTADSANQDGAADAMLPAQEAPSQSAASASARDSSTADAGASADVSAADIASASVDAAADPAATPVPATDPMPPAGGTGWAYANNEAYWFDDGVMARDKQVYDPGSNAWYWFDADGTMARDKDVFIPVSNDDRTHGKWVRYDASGHMVKGEDCRYGGWYWFDLTTGEMAKGFVYVSSGQKWVFYDYVTGQMRYGEQGIDGNWYYLDPVTGAVTYGWHWFDNAAKWVFYEWPSGIMAHGDHRVGSRDYRFDPITGALDPAQTPASTDLPSNLVSPLSLGALVSSGSVRSVRVLGDSIMAGMGSLDYAGDSDRVLFRFNDRTYYEPAAGSDSASGHLRDALSARGVRMVNASVPGLGSMNFFNRLGEAALGDEDLAVVVLGTNDRGEFDPTETIEGFRAYAEGFLTLVSERYQGRMIVLSSIPVEQETYNFPLSAVSDELRTLCLEHGWAFASLYDAFSYVADAQGMPLGALYVDGTHPNRIGQEVLWDALSQVLAL